MSSRPLVVAAMLALGCNRPAAEPEQEAAPQPEAPVKPEASAKADAAQEPDTASKPQPASLAKPRLVLGSSEAMLSETGALTFRGAPDDAAWLAKQGRIEDIWLDIAICVRTASGISCKRWDGETRIEPPTKAPVIDLVWSYGSICALTSDEAMWCGFGKDAGSKPLRPYPVAGVVDIELQDEFGCARSNDGSARCWLGDRFVLGDFCKDNASTPGCNALDEDQASWPAPNWSFPNTRDIAVGSRYACILDEHGKPQCRDESEYDDTRIGEFEQFVAIDGMPPLIDIDGGLRHVCGRSEMGEVWCWGSNDHGQLGDGTTQSQTRSTPVRTGTFAKLEQLVVESDQTCVVADGQVHCWGWLTGTPVDPIPTQIPGIVASEIEVREFSACARVEAGWKCWGGQFSLGGITEDCKIVDSTRTDDFGDGCRFTAGRLRCDDGVDVWLDMRGVVDVVRTSDPLCWLQRDRVECRYSVDEESAVFRVPPSVAIRGTVEYGCVLTESGEVHCWTFDAAEAARVELPGKQIALAVGFDDDACALDEAGTVRCWSAENSVIVAGVTDTVELHGGDGFGCARDRAGAIACWGPYLVADANTPGAPPDQPVAIQLPAPAAEFGIGKDFGCARLEDGRVFCWGAEMYGQRARVSAEFVTRPQPVAW